MGLNIYVILFVGLFCHSIKAQSACNPTEKQQVKACLQQATQDQSVNGLQMLNVDQQAGPCLSQAGCNGAASGTGFGSVLSSFGFGGQPQPNQPQPSNGNDEQCYSAVTKNVRDHMGQCIQQKIPHFDKNDAHIGSGHGHGQGGVQQSNLDQELAQKCNNDKIKIRKVKACMLNTQYGQQQYQQTVQKGCQCAQQVTPACRHELEQHRQAACGCAHDIEQNNMYQTFEQQNGQICQGQAISPDGMMAVFQKMDCNADPCQNSG